MSVPSLEELRALLALADHPDQGPCDAIRFDQASGALMRGLLGKKGPEYLDAHNTCLHALVDGLRKLGLMDRRSIFVSIGPMRIWAHVTSDGEVVITGTETDA